MRFLFTHRFSWFDITLLAVAAAVLDAKGWFLAFAVIGVGSLIGSLSEHHYSIKRSDP